jgi:hypothetical protein
MPSPSARVTTAPRRRCTRAARAVEAAGKVTPPSTTADDLDAAVARAETEPRREEEAQGRTAEAAAAFIMQTVDIVFVRFVCCLTCGAARLRMALGAWNIQREGAFLSGDLER